MKSPLSGLGRSSSWRSSRSSLLAGALFTVDPTEQALVLRFGQPVRDLIGAPGLYVKWPFIDTVVYIDKRILALDDERQEVLVADNQRLEVDAFVRYRISDPLLFYQSVGSIQGRQRAARRHAQFGAAPHPGRGLDHRHRARQARRADGRHSRPGESGRRALRPRRRRRAHQARRPAAGKFGSGVPPHADRAPAARGEVPRARLAAEPADQGRGRPQGDGDHRPGAAASPSRSAARATPNATASSPRAMARTPTSSPSTARCRPTRPA